MSTRTLISKISPFLAATRSPSLHRIRPVVSAGQGVLRRSVSASVSGVGIRSFSSRPTTSSLNDPFPNWSNRPPKEKIPLAGCDFEHWLIVMEPPKPQLNRDEIIDYYIKTLAQVVGSEQEARMKVYSVSTKHYFAFGALVSEDISYKIKTLPKVRWVLPDSYLDEKNKDYGGEDYAVAIQMLVGPRVGGDYDVVQLKSLCSLSLYQSMSICGMRASLAKW